MDEKTFALIITGTVAVVILGSMFIAWLGSNKDTDVTIQTADIYNAALKTLAGNVSWHDEKITISKTRDEINIFLNDNQRTPVFVAGEALYGFDADGRRYFPTEVKLFRNGKWVDYLLNEVVRRERLKKETADRLKWAEENPPIDDREWFN